MHRLIFIPLILLALFVAAVPAALLVRVSPQEMLRAISSAETLFALRLSAITSLSAVTVAVLLGVPAAHLLARRDFPGKAVVELVLDLPLVMTPLVAGVGLLFLFGRMWPGRALSDVGLQVLFTPLGAVVAQTFVAAPVLTRTCRAAFEAVNPRYELAGRTMGLSPLRIFCRITLPLARQGLLAGVVLAWARALGEFGATLMVAGATRFKTATLPIAVYLNISSGEIGLALAGAWLLLVAGGGLLVLLRWIGRPPAGRPAGGGSLP